MRFLVVKKFALNLTFLVCLNLTLCIFSPQCACSLAKNLAYGQKIRKLEANRNLHVLFFCIWNQNLVKFFLLIPKDTILNHLEKSVRDEQITTLKYNFLFPFKNSPHQNTTSFSLSVRYNMTKRLSRTTLHVLTINIVIYNKYVRKPFGVTSEFFLTFTMLF